MSPGTHLQSFATRVFPVEPAEHVSGSVHASFRELYDGYNGGYYFGGAVLVRPAVVGWGSVLSTVDWNVAELWKGRFGAIAAGLQCFAENLFGEQFSLSSGVVVRFDPETGEREHLAPTLSEWFRLLSSDPDVVAQQRLLEEWQVGNRLLLPGERLTPLKPFFLGGDYATDNLAAERDVEGMLWRAQLWEQTKDLPDGTTVVFRRAP